MNLSKLFAISVLAMTLFSINAFAGIANEHYEFHTTPVNSISGVLVFDDSKDITAHYSFRLYRAVGWGWSEGLCGYRWYVDGQLEEAVTANPGGACLTGFHDLGFEFDPSGLDVDTKHTVSVQVDTSWAGIGSTTTRNIGFYVKTVTPSTPTTPQNNPPQYGLSINPRSGTAPLFVTFDLSSSMDLDGYITDYAINFGDGTSDSGTRNAFTHTYTSAGTFGVRITITDNDGATTSAEGTVTVTAPTQPPQTENQPPVISNIAIQLDQSSQSSGTVIVDTPSTMTFIADASDPDGTITSYAWNFDDGTTGSGQSVTHTYTDAGTYTITLTVTDDDGAQDTDTTEVTLRSPTPPPEETEETAPIAAFTFTNSTPTIFNFYDFSRDDGEIVKRIWNFGDLGTERITPEWTYTHSGWVVSFLSMTSSTYTFRFMDATDDITVTFKTGENTDISPWNEVWYFRSPGADSVEIVRGTGSDSTNPVIQFPDIEKIYDIYLTVKDDTGNKATAYRQLAISPPTPPNQAPVIGNLPGGVTINRNHNLSFAPIVTDADGIASYEWDINRDGVADHFSSRTGNFSYNFTEIGTFYPIFRTTDNTGMTATYEIRVSVVESPIAPLSVHAGPDKTVTLGSAVNLIGTVSGDREILLYEWDFNYGEGVDWSSSFTGVTSYVYPQAGIYVARFTVTDNEGRRYHDSARITVRPESTTSQSRESRYSYSSDAISILRTYNYNGGTGITTISLRAVNLKGTEQTVLLRESIPKTMAASVDEISFSVRPDIIYNIDPEMGWNRTLRAYNSFEVIYTIDRYVSPTTFLSMSAPGITVKAPEQDEEDEPVEPTSTDITGLAFGIMGNAWFGGIVLILALLAFWKKEFIVRKWNGFKKARGWTE
jgi:PKD repeat protein